MSVPKGLSCGGTTVIDVSTLRNLNNVPLSWATPPRSFALFRVAARVLPFSPSLPRVSFPAFSGEMNVIRTKRTRARARIHSYLLFRRWRRRDSKRQECAYERIRERGRRKRAREGGREGGKERERGKGKMASNENHDFSPSCAKVHTIGSHLARRAKVQTRR